jgi:AcrR family transcriptional regulator
MSRLKAPQRKEQLLAVATKVFAKFGYDATTTKVIAKAAGITEPILYRHFATKQELFVAITREMSAQTLRDWEELIGSIDDPAEQLRELARQFPSHLKKRADAYRVIHNALTTSRDRKVLSVLREHYTQIESVIAKIISSGIKSGVFRTMELKTPCWNLINTGLGFALVTLNLSPMETFDVEEAIEFILRGLTSGN